jgi:hypothetical protein
MVCCIASFRGTMHAYLVLPIILVIILGHSLAQRLASMGILFKEFRVLVELVPDVEVDRHVVPGPVHVSIGDRATLIGVRIQHCRPSFALQAVENDDQFDGIET